MISSSAGGDATSPWMRLASRALIAIPLATLAVASISWIVFGTDLPFRDDWFPLRTRDMGNFSFDYLMTPVLDTLMPVGKVLDGLAFHLLRNNSIAYQFLQILVCLGGLMWLQWQLLSAAFSNRAIVVAAFSLTVFMLQPGSYWGQVSNLAYHQLLPLMALMAVLFVAVRAKSRPWLAAGAVFALGVLGGLSYISGAFVAFGVAGALALASLRDARLRPALWGLLAAIAVTVTMQGRVLLANRGRTINPETSMVWPWDQAYWAFFLGKVSRALMTYELPFVLALASAAIFVALAAWMALRRLPVLARGVKDEEEANRALVVVGLCACVLVYMLVISAARAGFRINLETASFRQAFENGFPRFHFFWITVLIPWVFACAAQALWPRIGSWLTLGGAALVAAAALAAGVGDNPRVFAREYDHSTRYGIECIQANVLDGGAIECPQIGERMAAAWKFGEDNRLTFTRYVTPTLREFAQRLRYVEQQLAARLPKPAPRSPAVEVSKAEVLEKTASGAVYAVTSDTRLVGYMPDVGACRSLVVEATITVEKPVAVRVIFRQDGKTDGDPTNTPSRFVPADRPSTVRFFNFSINGFHDSFMLLPGRWAQKVKVENLRYWCRY